MPVNALNLVNFNGIVSIKLIVDYKFNQGYKISLV